MNIRAARLHADLAQHREGCVAHDLIFLVGQREGRGHGDRIAGMNTHRVNIFDGADDDAVVGGITHDFHLIFFPTDNAFFHQYFIGWGCIDAALDDFEIFLAVIGNAAARAAHGEGRADDGGKTDGIQRVECFAQIMRQARARGFQPDLGHGFAELLAVFGLVDDMRLGADHLDIPFFQHTHFVERKRGVECGLAAHGGKQNELFVRALGALFFDNAGHHFRRDRLDIGGVRQIGVRHDGGGVRIDQNDSIALGFQRLAGLRPGIVEFAGLADDDRSRPDNEDGVNICPLRHGSFQYV